MTEEELNYWKPTKKGTVLVIKTVNGQVFNILPDPNDEKGVGHDEFIQAIKSAWVSDNPVGFLEIPGALGIRLAHITSYQLASSPAN